MHFPTDRTAHTMAFDGPVVERKIAQTANASRMQARLDNPNLYRPVLYCLRYIPPPTSTLIQINEYSVIMVYLIYLSQNIKKIMQQFESHRAMQL